MFLQQFLNVIKNITMFCILLQSSKPVMEKRRRARINNSLNQLKNILLEALKKDVRILS